VVKSAENAARQIQDVFSNLQIAPVASSLDFSAAVASAQSAAAEITTVFQSINISSAVNIDFSAAVASAQTAATQIAQAFQSISAGGFNDFVNSLAEALNQLPIAANAAAQGISAAINSISFSGLIGQINQAITAFDNMTAAANRAAQAAQNAQSSGGGGSFGSGGLFRGRPGIDANLAWLSDYEFVVRPEAVRHYGIPLLQALNAMQLRFDGFRAGGLNVMHRMAAFRDGGIVLPQIRVPAFAAGGIAGDKSPRSGSSSRPFTIVIGGQSFGGLTAPEDTAKALERAAIRQQLTATGVRPRWNK
jgi:hypothetical protein